MQSPKPLLAAMCAAGISTLSLHAAAPLAPTNLRVNDVTAPVGVGGAPQFGWYVNDPDANEIQSKYQILVASSQAHLDAGRGDLWDSGEIADRLQNHVPYAGKPLAADTQYFWKVRTWDKGSAAGPYSAAGNFTVGPLKNEDWTGALWIRRDTNVADDYTYYRKNFALPNKPIARATVYISSAHKYELFINGQFAGNGPAYQYPQYQYYNGWDVTGLLKPGADNLFAIFNHWFGGGQGRAGSARGVIMKAVVHFTDGTSAVLATDGTWKQLAAEQWIIPQRQRGGEGIGYVEYIDGRKQIPDWYKPGFDDKDWAAATVIGAQPVAPWTGNLNPDLTRIVQTVIEPASVRDWGNGSYTVDLGKVWAGRPQINFSGGTSGTVVNVQAGYGLDANGFIDPRRNQSTTMTYFAVLNGQAFTFQPAGYMGMRYVQIDGSPAPVTKDNFRFVTRHSQLDGSRSSFTSANTTLNNVWDLMKHTIFASAQEEFVDTPTREQGGFLGDGYIQGVVAMPVHAERLLNRRQLEEFRTSMDQFWSAPEERGRVNAVYPNGEGNGKRDIPDYSQGYLLWVWEYYMETGDKPFLRDTYEHLKQIGGYNDRSIYAPTGLIYYLPGGGGAYNYGIIDWPAPMRFGYDMTSARTVINAWAYADYVDLALAAEALGNTADRDTYRAKAEALKAAMNARLINQSCVYVDGVNDSHEQSAHVSQQANTLPLALGIVPDIYRPTVAAKVKELQMRSGMQTVLWLVRALGEADEGPHLIELYTNPEWLGWARELAQGATTTWEDWSSNTDGQSESHGWGAAGLEGYVRYILGVKALKPQYEQVQIKPLFFGDKLPSASGTIPTDRGDIAVDWKREGANYSLKVGLPVNITSVVYVPKGSRGDATVKVDGANVAGIIEGNYVRVNNIGSGTHTFERAL